MSRLGLRNGDIVWHKENLAGRYPCGLAADDERIYVSTPSGAIQALDPEAGRELWRVNTGNDLLDMTPYERGVRSLLAAPVRLVIGWSSGANDGVLRLLDPASGAVHAEAALGAPITAPVQPVGERVFLLSTWGRQIASLRQRRSLKMTFYR